jgi:uncharacterized OB-fold protein
MGTPNLPPRFDTDIVRPYWAALERGELCLPACSECGQWQWYPYEFVRCHSNAHHEWKTVATTGTVFAFTEVHRNFLPTGSRDDVPYFSALIELDRVSGPRIAGILTNLGSVTPKVGLRVMLQPIRLAAYTLPAFAPLTETTT